MRMPVLVGVVVLALATCRAASPSPPPLQLLSVKPEKVLYDAGEPVTGAVTVKNVSKAPQTVTVRAWLEWQLDLRTKPQEVKLTIEPEKSAAAAFTWKRVPEQFGHAMKAEVLQEGKAIAAGQDYFQVSNNLWKTGIIAAMGAHSKTPEFVNDLRRRYFNVFEVFFWAPDDFLELTPEQNSWSSGQSRYGVVKEGSDVFPYFGKVYGLKDLIAMAHGMGIKAVTYAKLTGCGPAGFETARRHPEMVWQSGGVLSCSPDAESLAFWDVRGHQVPSSWLPVDYSMNDPKVVDIGIKELADSAEMFGWDGARWDGNFSVRSEVYDLEGKLIERLTSEQREARNADNMRRAKQYISRRFPRYVYGYNYIGATVADSLLFQPRETAELCKGGGLLMNEYIRNSADVNHPLHNWRKFAETLVDDTQRIKQLGGYMGPIFGLGNADAAYGHVFAYAGGAHPYYSSDFGAFMTRFSFYCWDPALRQVPLPETTVTVAGNLWWDKWVFTRDLSPTRRQMVVHLINPPTDPQVGRQVKLPPPQRNVTVSYLPFAQPGWKLSRVTRLNVTSMAPESLPVTESYGALSVVVPEVALWNILVFDLVKEGR